MTSFQVTTVKHGAWLGARFRRTGTGTDRRSTSGRLAGDPLPPRGGARGRTPRAHEMNLRLRPGDGTIIDRKTLGTTMICPSCRTSNVAEARFCMKCGAALQPSAPHFQGVLRGRKAVP